LTGADRDHASTPIEVLLRQAAELQLQGKSSEAEKLYMEALRIDQNNLDALSELATIAFGTRRTELGAMLCKKAVELYPAAPSSHNNWAYALAKMNRFEEALECCERAIALQPDFAEAYNTRGIVLRNLQRYDEALASYDKAISLNPDFARAYNNRGIVLQNLERHDRALASFDQAISLMPDYAEACWNKALFKLLLGQFDEGWRLYEWRKRTSDALGSRKYSRPEWCGDADLSGKTLFAYFEQGLGDTIQFCRYASLAEARGARVVLSVQDKLIRLLSGMSSTIEIVGAETTPPVFDYHIALLSMPFAFTTNAANIPNKTPYLRAEPERAERWAQRIGSHGFKIGIAWQGAKLAADIGRSFSVVEFAGIANIPHVRLISLQKGAGVEQLKYLSEGMRVESFADELDSGDDSFVDTASLAQSLELGITSDTSIAHLAGALARPTWLLLRSSPDWRWMLQRSDSPWYPTMRLFRQKRAGDWSSVFAAVERELAVLVSKKI
jgi:tetratricopeptide (TPR) repeat protein